MKKILFLTFLFIACGDTQKIKRTVIYCQGVYLPYNKEIELHIFNSFKDISEEGFLRYDVTLDKNMNIVKIEAISDIVDSIIYKRLYPFIKKLSFKPTKPNKEKLILSTIYRIESGKMYKLGGSDTLTQWRSISPQLCDYFETEIYIMFLKNGKKKIIYFHEDVYELPPID